MFLTVHASSGLFIGSQISTPWLAFLLGLISHLIIDAIPHGDESLAEKWSGATKIKKLSLIVAVDMIGVFFLSYWLISGDFADLSPAVLAALIGSILPDYIWGLHEITKDKISGWISSHILNWFHQLIPWRIPFLHGLLIQSATLAIFVFLLIN